MSAGLRARVLSWLNGVQPRLDAVNVFLLRRETIPDAAWSLYRENAPYDLAAAITLLREAALDGQGDAAPRVAPAQWQPIETHKGKGLVLVALIRDGVIWRVSDASFNGLGWYTKSGEACHWRTHWMPLPSPPATSGSGDEARKR